MSAVDLWWVDPRQVREPALLRAYEGLVTAEERQRGDAFAFPHLRHDWLVARALVRTTLSRYADVPPGAWRFRAGVYGRPEVVGPIIPPLRFNLSHTRGAILCGVGTGVEVGVDVENSEQEVPHLELSERVFAPFEVKQLRKLPAAAIPERFFALWTLKESYIKARGMGLAIPLDVFWFDLEAPGPLRIHFAAGWDDQPGRWTFERFALGPAHPAALAMQDGQGLSRVTRRYSVPLLGP